MVVLKFEFNNFESDNMKRSEINQIIREAKEFLASRQFILPEWAEWSLADWKANRDKVDYIVERMLGWDITDFGSGDFKRCGLFLFTIRNGKYGVDKKPYAEKIMIVEELQETPMHFHWSKMEDIINRGGGNLVIEPSATATTATVCSTSTGDGAVRMTATSRSPCSTPTTTPASAQDRAASDSASITVPSSTSIR